MNSVKLISVTPDAEKLMAYCAKVVNQIKNIASLVAKYVIKPKEICLKKIL